VDLEEREGGVVSVTTAQAATMWCPMARMLPKGSVRPAPVNAWETGIASCRGPNCMMWRWDRDASHNIRQHVAEDVTATTEPPRPAGIPQSWIFTPFEDTNKNPAAWNEPEADARVRWQGYCGLAGAERLFV